MTITLPGHLAAALGWMGVQFPATDESALGADAATWQAAANVCQTQLSETQAAVTYLLGCNKGPAATAFATYMGGRANVSGLGGLAAASGRISAGCATVAETVADLKRAIIAEAAGIQRLHLMTIALTFNPIGMFFARQLWDNFERAVAEAGARCHALEAQAASRIRG